MDKDTLRLLIIENICWALGSCAVSAAAFWATGSFWSLSPMALGLMAVNSFKSKQ